MGSNKPIPIPSDLATVGMGKLTVGIARHYGVSEFTARAWLKTMAPEWLAAFHAAGKAMRADLAKFHINRARQILASDPQARVRKKPLRAAPDGLFDDLMTMEHQNVQLKHVCSHTLLARWIGELPAVQQQQVMDTMRARIRAEAAIRAAKGRAVASAKAAAARAAKPPKEPKPRAARTQRSGYSLARRPGTNLVTQAPSGADALAMRHLMTRYKPVCRLETLYPKEKPGRYIVGQRKVDRDELMALAAQHGWSPDSWRQVAA